MHEKAVQAVRNHTNIQSDEARERARLAGITSGRAGGLPGLPGGGTWHRDSLERGRQQSSGDVISRPGQARLRWL